MQKFAVAFIMSLLTSRCGNDSLHCRVLAPSMVIRKLIDSKGDYQVCLPRITTKSRIVV